MMTETFLNTEPLGTNLDTRQSFGYFYPLSVRYRHLVLSWGLHQDTNPVPLAAGQVDFLAFARRTEGLVKLERQHRERLAAVALDTGAKTLLSALDRETSIRWEDLPDRAGGDWSEASRSAALLAGANLCDVSPTRIRLNEHGDKLLAESSQAGEAESEVAS